MRMLLSLSLLALVAHPGDTRATVVPAGFTEFQAPLEVDALSVDLGFCESPDASTCGIAGLAYVPGDEWHEWTTQFDLESESVAAFLQKLTDQDDDVLHLTLSYAGEVQAQNSELQSEFFNQPVTDFTNWEVIGMQLDVRINPTPSGYDVFVILYVFPKGLPVETVSWGQMKTAFK